MRFRAPVFAFLVVSAALAAAQPAAAAGRNDPYAVSDVAVDVTAQDSSKARQQGFAQAQVLAFARLIKRLTLPEDLARIGPPALADSQLDQIVDGVDIQEEGRSGVRYLARLAVNFDPGGVRRVLQERGLKVVDTRTAPILVVPLAKGTPAETAAGWRKAWEQGGFSQELAPIAVAPAETPGAPDWNAVQSAAAAAGATSALFATLQASGGEWSVEMVEVAANGVRRDRGRFSAPVPAATFAQATMQAFATAANDRVQGEWKQRLAAGAGQRVRVSAVARYEKAADWQRVKQALAKASATLISDIQIEAVHREGATLSFSHIGSDEQLAAELGRYGVRIEKTPQGVVLRAAGGA